jgi:DNA-binding MarR family transcriptional regulator
VDETSSVRPERAADLTTVMDSLRALVRALRISTRAVEKEIGISGAQLFVLQRLEHASARSVNELAERTSTHQSSVSTVVSRLVERGLAQRTASAEDGRRMEISITARGLELLRQAPRTAQIAMQEALLRMDADQVSALAAGLVVLVREGGFGDLAVPMFFEEDAAGNS